MRLYLCYAGVCLREFAIVRTRAIMNVYYAYPVNQRCIQFTSIFGYYLYISIELISITISH